MKQGNQETYKHTDTTKEEIIRKIINSIDMTKIQIEDTEKETGIDTRKENKTPMSKSYAK